jgi:hypothetical protein
VRDCCPWQRPVFPSRISSSGRRGPDRFRLDQSDGDDAEHAQAAKALAQDDNNPYEEADADELIWEKPEKRQTAV